MSEQDKQITEIRAAHERGQAYLKKEWAENQASEPHIHRGQLLKIVDSQALEIERLKVLVA